MARRTKEDADATRNSLLDAAERVFYEKGVARASLNEIAQAAGTTRGAIYWHFKDKVDLFLAMMDRVTLPLEGACTASEATSPAVPLRRLLAVVDRVLRSVVHDEQTRRVFEIAMYRVEYVDELLAVRERHLASHARFHDLLMRDLDLAAREQDLVLPMDAATAASGLQGLFDGLLYAWLLGNEPFDLLATGCATVTAYLQGLGFCTQPPCDNGTL